MTNNEISQLALMAVYKIIDEEGGFVYTDHPVDPDQGTYAGIRYQTFCDFTYEKDKKQISAMEFKELSHGSILNHYVLDIYYQKYFFQMNLLKLPSRLIMPVFSCGVNCGTRKAIKILQKSCNEMEDVRTLLKVDGINGERTSNFVHRLCFTVDENKLPATDHTDKVRNNFIKNWIHYYIKIVNHNHKQAVFILGWFNRVNKYWVV